MIEVNYDIDYPFGPGKANKKIMMVCTYISTLYSKYNYMISGLSLSCVVP